MTKNFVLISLSLLEVFNQNEAAVAPYLARNQAWLQQAFDQGLKYLTAEPIVNAGQEDREQFNPLFLLQTHPQWVQDHLPAAPLSRSSFWNQIETYQLQYWPQIKGWCKTSTDWGWYLLPVEIRQQILSYLRSDPWVPTNISNEAEEKGNELFGSQERLSEDHGHELTGADSGPIYYFL